MDGKPVTRRNKINIQIPGDLEATYTNFSVISHTASEVIIDFARLMPNTPNSKVYARVVMTPMNAKLLQKALATNIAKYESQFGEINLRGADKDAEQREIGFHRSTRGNS